MSQALQRQHELTLAATRGLPDGTRSSCDLLRPYISERNSKFSSHQKFIVKAFATGGCWTR
eukprot:1236932-Pyramimonas_sp.AAC.1